MSAAVAFADIGDFRATSFPNVSRLEADQFYFEPEISSEDCFEGIVGKSPALRKSPGACCHCCADGFHCAAAWRDGDRKGIGRTRDSQFELAP